MNMWGLISDSLGLLEAGFQEFFEKEVTANPLICDRQIGLIFEVRLGNLDEIFLLR